MVVSCAAESLATSAEDIFGVSYRYGKNSTVRAILSALFFVMEHL